MCSYKLPAEGNANLPSIGSLYMGLPKIVLLSLMGGGVVLAVSQSGMRKAHSSTEQALGLALGCWCAQPSQIPRQGIYHAWKNLLHICPEMPTGIDT